MSRKPTTSKLSAAAAIEQVLGASRKPMRVPAIIEAAVPLTGLKGKTPGQTIYSVLYAEAKKGSASKFERVDRGTFRLRKVRAAKTEKAEVEANATA